MMKYQLIFSALSLTLILASCKKDKTELAENKKTSDSIKVEPEVHQELYGIYTGNFEKEYDPNSDDYSEEYNIKKLSIKLNRITKDSVYGYSIVNGNQRPFRGVYNKNSKKFVLDEPGDDKTDGRFLVNLRKDSLVGTWDAFDAKAVKSPKKTVKLLKKQFVYNSNFMLDKDKSDIVDWTTTKRGEASYVDDDGKKQSYETEKQRYASDAIFTVNASKKVLTEKEIKNLKKLDLEIIKNAIFARHGYSFKKQTYRQFFDFQDWYVPVSNNVDAELTPLEKENVALLNRFIKYAEDNYDNFGR
ncbi:YARHG domain-containing protein [Chryseobacterium sp. T1]